MKKNKILLVLLWAFGAALNGFSAFAVTEETVKAVPANDFLNSIGANSAIYRRGENLDKTIECCQYAGIRWIRMDEVNPEQIKLLYEKGGVKVSCSLGSANQSKDYDLDGFVNRLREAQKSGALIAVEGLNEPNNWGVRYQGENGGGANAKTWLPVAKLHRDLYQAVKSDPDLKKLPVWATTETGAQPDNCGMQFLTIPQGAGTLMPDGTQYADVATCHNYFTHPSWPGLHDNQTWISSSPGKDCRVDGLYGNYGLTWGRKYQGYSEAELETLPRVTTETGITISGDVTEEIQALLFMSCYLSQYKRGWNHTAMYILRDRTDEAGNQSFGFYKGDYTPRKGAHYMHNLTTILADETSIENPSELTYSILPERPETVHELLLQKNDGTLMLVVWGEKYAPNSTAENIEIKFETSYKRINVYDPTKGTTPQVYTNVNSVTLSMLNHPYVIELKDEDSGASEVCKPALDQFVPTILEDELRIPASYQLNHVALVSMQGDVLYKQDVVDGLDLNIDVRNLDSGLYLLQLMDKKNRTESVKILKR